MGLVFGSGVWVWCGSGVGLVWVWCLGLVWDMFGACAPT